MIDFCKKYYKQIIYIICVIVVSVVMFIMNMMAVQAADVQDTRWYVLNISQNANAYQEIEFQGYIGVPKGYYPVYSGFNGFGSVMLINVATNEWTKYGADINGMFSLVRMGKTEINYDTVYSSGIGNVYIKGTAKCNDKAIWNNLYSPALDNIDTINSSLEVIIDLDSYLAEGNEYIESDYSSLNELKNELQKTQYPSPQIDHVENANTSYFLYLKRQEPMPDDLTYYATVYTTDLNGVTTGTLLGDDKTANYYPLSYVLRDDKETIENPYEYNGYLKLNYEYLAKYLYNYAGLQSETIDYIEFELYYDYSGVLSKKSKFKYDFNDGSINGSYWNDSTGDYVTIDPIINPGNKSDLVVDTPDSTSVKGLFEFLSDALLTFTTTCKSVLNALIELFSSGSKLAAVFGSFFSIFFGNVGLGVIITGSIIAIIIMRILGR